MILADRLGFKAALPQDGGRYGGHRGQEGRRRHGQPDEGDALDDDCFGTGTIRQDGRALVPAYLFQVKAPAESHGPWDYYKLLATTPGAEAFRPLADGRCPFVKA